VLSGLLCDLEADNGWPLIFYVYGKQTYRYIHKYDDDDNNNNVKKGEQGEHLL